MPEFCHLNKKRLCWVMRRYKRLQALFTFVLAFGLSVHTVHSAAVEKLSAQPLLSSCSSASENNSFAYSPCAMKVLGLFEGMEIYRNRPASCDTHFQKRALETQIGSRLTSGGTAEQARYCLPVETTLAGFIGQLNSVDSHNRLSKRRLVG